MPRPIRTALVACITSSLLSGVVPAWRVDAACWLPPVDAPVSDPFRRPPCRWCPGNRGIEYATAPGSPVRAVAAGRVSFAGSVAGRRYVVVRHADGRRATYGDLGTITVRSGDSVVARSIVGLSADSFHFGLRLGDEYVDPSDELGRLVHPTRLVPADGGPSAPSGPPRVRCDRAEKPVFPGANPFRRR